jgi:hypothetical protein
MIHGCSPWPMSARRAPIANRRSLDIPVVGSEVEMEAILDRLHLWHRNEEKAGKSFPGGPNLELVGRFVHDHPSECSLPLAPQ